MFWELAIRNKYINWLILETSRKLAIGLEAGNLSIGCFSKYLQQQCLFHSNFIFIQKFLVLIYHQLQKDRKVRLRVGTSDYEHLWAKIWVTKMDYWWLWVITSDEGPEYEWLQLTTSNYNIWLPYLWPYLMSECRSKNTYSTLSLDNNWRGLFEDVSKICWI